MWRLSGKCLYCLRLILVYLDVSGVFDVLVIFLEEAKIYKHLSRAQGVPHERK